MWDAFFQEKRFKKSYFKEIAEKRYEAEPYIKGFAYSDSETGKNKKILEIGVGAGTDFWDSLERNAILLWN